MLLDQSIVLQQNRPANADESVYDDAYQLPLGMPLDGYAQIYELYDSTEPYDGPEMS
jgi:hypothetical protein